MEDLGDLAAANQVQADSIAAAGTTERRPGCRKDVCTFRGLDSYGVTSGWVKRHQGIRALVQTDLTRAMASSRLLCAEPGLGLSHVRVSAAKLRSFGGCEARTSSACSGLMDFGSRSTTSRACPRVSA
eukprot:s4886_g3.t1